MIQTNITGANIYVDCTIFQNLYKDITFSFYKLSATIITIKKTIYKFEPIKYVQLSKSL